MMVRCEECGARFDDALRLTYCPHDKLMDDKSMKQKIAAIALSDGGPVRFAHQKNTGPDYRILSISWDGMITLDALHGEFAPHLFVKSR